MIKFQHKRPPAVPHEPKASPKSPYTDVRYCSLCPGEIERIPAHAATRGSKVVPA